MNFALLECAAGGRAPFQSGATAPHSKTGPRQLGTRAVDRTTAAAHSKNALESGSGWRGGAQGQDVLDDVAPAEDAHELAVREDGHPPEVVVD